MTSDSGRKTLLTDHVLKRARAATLKDDHAGQIRLLQLLHLISSSIGH